MKILLSSTRNEWYIESGEGWYALNDPAGIEQAVSVLPLRIIDDYKDVDQFPFEGTASVLGIENDIIRIEFKDIAGKNKLTEITIDDACLCSRDWCERPFEDGWVRANSQIRLDNLSAFSLKIFAPKIEGQSDKIINIKNETKGESWNFTLIRGQENMLELLSEPYDGEQEFLLICDAEPMEGSTDTRSLGFVLVDEIISV